MASSLSSSISTTVTLLDILRPSCSTGFLSLCSDRCDIRWTNHLISLRRKSFVLRIPVVGFLLWRRAMLFITSSLTDQDGLFSLRSFSALNRKKGRWESFLYLWFSLKMDVTLAICFFLESENMKKAAFSYICNKLVWCFYHKKNLLIIGRQEHMSVRMRHAVLFVRLMLLASYLKEIKHLHVYSKQHGDL